MFRYTYSSLLCEYGKDAKAVQELTRHAKVSTTMEVYRYARMEKKREAQSKVLDVLFDPSESGDGGFNRAPQHK